MGQLAGYAFNQPLVSYLKLGILWIVASCLEKLAIELVDRVKMYI